MQQASVSWFPSRSLALLMGSRPPVDPDNLTSIIRPFLIRNKISVDTAVEYCDRVLRDWKNIKSFLPADRKHILDIGCGWGGHTLYLGKHYQGTSISVIEGTENLSKVHTAFREEIQPYRDGRFAVQLLNSYGIKAQFSEVGEQTYNSLFVQVDFVVSFAAWGYLFPLWKYLPVVQRSLVSGGYVLVDIRQGTNGHDQFLKTGFNEVSIIKECQKYIRILFQKK